MPDPASWPASLRPKSQSKTPRCGIWRAGRTSGFPQPSAGDGDARCAGSRPPHRPPRPPFPPLRLLGLGSDYHRKAACPSRHRDDTANDNPYPSPRRRLRITGQWSARWCQQCHPPKATGRRGDPSGGSPRLRPRESRIQNGEALLAVPGLGLQLITNGAGPVMKKTTAATVTFGSTLGSLPNRPAGFRIRMTILVESFQHEVEKHAAATVHPHSGLTGSSPLRFRSN